MRYTHKEMVQALSRWAGEEEMDVHELETALLALARHSSEEDLLALFPREITAYGYPIEDAEDAEVEDVTHYLRYGNQTTWCGLPAAGLKAYHAYCRPGWEYFQQACPACKAEATRKGTLNGAVNTGQSKTRAAS
jgi:hypothetical protein